MTEEDLNIKYIREKTGLAENDELIPIILEMIQESYKAGLCQAEYDNTMGLVEENQQLKEQQKEFIDYLDKEIEKCKYFEGKYADGDDMSYHDRNELREEILSKYKEIIRSDK